MKHLGSVIDEIVNSSHAEMQKVSNADLLSKTASPNISSELGLALLKTAALLKEAKEEVSYEDLHRFMEKIRDA